MKEIALEELKEIQIDILSKVNSFCKKNGINYSLTYGTLIGAIRHKGYIPWDDDIDIAMPRPDYDRFINTFNGVYDNLYVLAPEIDNKYYAPYANVCDNRTILIEESNNHCGEEIGIKIDVFPVDGTFEDDIDYKFQVRKLKKYNHILSVKRMSRPYPSFKSFLICYAYKALYGLYNYSKIQEQIKDECMLNSYNDSTFVDFVSFPIYDNSRVPSVYYSKYIEVDFEGCRFMAIQNYDSFLKTIYGDYMKLPPVEKRVLHHGFKAYWKD